MNRLLDVVAAAQEAGVLRGGDTMFMATHLLQSIVFGPTTAAMLGATIYESKNAQDKYFEQAWDLFLRRAAPR